MQSSSYYSWNSKSYSLKMATYLSNKIRAFRGLEDPPSLPLNCKSLFHMKTYSSATDPRAWSPSSQDRKQYILEMFSAEEAPREEFCIGKYVSVQALLKTLLANKDADILYLQNQLDILEMFLENLDLNQEQLKILHEMKTPVNVDHVEPEDSKNTSTPDEGIPNVNNNSVVASSQCDMIIDEFDHKLQEKEIELAKQQAVVNDAMEQLASVESIISERDSLKKKNRHLKKTMEWMRSTSSLCNDVELKSEIIQLRQQLQKYEMQESNRSDRMEIVSKPKQHEMGSCTCDNYIDLKQIVEERDELKNKVHQLLAQHEDFSKSSPKRKVSSIGDHASQTIDIENELKQEMDVLRAKLRDFEIKNFEFDRLQLRIDELLLIEAEYNDMKSKFKLHVQDHKNIVKQNMKQIENLTDECECLQAEIQRFSRYQDENNILAQRCKQYKCVIDEQLEQIDYLENCRNMPEASNSKINELKEELEKKTSMIKISEDKLINLQKQLRDSINNLTSESSLLKSTLQEAQGRIAELLEQETELQMEIKRLKVDVESKDLLLQSFTKEKLKMNNMCSCLPKMLQERDNVIEQMREKLLELEKENNHLCSLSSQLHHYIMKKPSTVHKGIGNCMTPACSIMINSKKQIEGIHDAMYQLQRELSHARLDCDDPKFEILQGKYQELQGLAKTQVHWIAGELRKCKVRVKWLECHVKHKDKN